MAVVAFGAAWVHARWTSPEGLPDWLPRPDPLVDWSSDPVQAQKDLRLLRAGLADLPDPPPAPRPLPDIVVIVLDTVRADRMGVYGYDRETTPNLDRWAQGARVFERMQSNGAWTLPSHASLFTGKEIRSHGARGTPPDTSIASPLREGSATFADALRRVGYRTVGIAANRAFLQPIWGLSQGFDLWLCAQLDLHAGLPYTSGDRITALAKAMLERPRSEPVLLFLNYMDAHAPWIPRRGFVREPAAIRPASLPYGEGWERAAEGVLADHRLAPATARSWSEAYDSELRFLDAQVGELLDALPTLGVGPEDFVFILSDHGEYLGEHDLVEHSKDLYQEVLHVPLLVRGPDYAPGRDDSPRQTHDLAWMILAAAQEAPLPGAARTVDLQVSELYWSRQRDLRNPRYAHRFDRIRRAFRLGDRKILLGTDGVEEAYALDLDPREAANVYGDAWTKELEGLAEAWRTSAEEVAPAKLGEGVDEAALRALGYVE